MALSELFTRVRAADAPDAVRAPAVAGRFYPGSPDTLRDAVRVLMDRARTRPPSAALPVAIVAPHAGYVYSGQIAADAFAQAAGASVELVVLLGAAHTRAGANVMAVYPGGAFRTPLGDAVVDSDAARALVDADAFLRLDASAHEAEHSIEVQVPFVQVLFPDARVLPIVVGKDDLASCERLGTLLAKVIGRRRVLVVASSDLSHYPSAADALRSDLEVLRLMAGFDRASLARRADELVASGVPNLLTAACGLAPVLAGMSAAQELGATHGRLVSHATSADVAIGDTGRVVGYGAVAFSSGAAVTDEVPHEGSGTSGPTRLDDGDRRALLALARSTVTQYLETETLPLPRDVPAHLQQMRNGAFVTLRGHGELRGCIGRLEHDGPLPQLVSAVAYEAAFQDSRFAPVSAEELDGLSCEVSVLSPLRPASVREIEVGRHGVLLRKDGRSAVFLPQVAAEHGWSRDDLLDHLCLKAGLPRRAWERNAAFFIFEADAFGDGGRE